MVLGERLRRLRQERRLSLEETARRLGISWSALAMYERGERVPSLERLHALAEFFAVSTDYLLGRSDRRELFRYPAQPSLAALPAYLRETGEASEADIQRVMEALGRPAEPAGEPQQPAGRQRGRQGGRRGRRPVS